MSRSVREVARACADAVVVVVAVVVAIGRLRTPKICTISYSMSFQPITLQKKHSAEGFCLFLYLEILVTYRMSLLTIEARPVCT